MGFANSGDVEDITPILPEDLEYGKKDKNTLYNKAHISYTDLYPQGSSQYTVERRVEIIKNFLDSQLHNYPIFQSILSEMIDHFVEGSGSKYSNVALTTAVQTHSRTQSYINSFIDVLKRLISERKGDIRDLLYDEGLWIQPTIRNLHPLVNALQQAIKGDEELNIPSNPDLNLPVYGWGNEVPGLFLAIDTIYSNRIQIESYHASNGEYSGVLKVIFYDHFGLDTEDLTKERKLNITASMFPGFRQWYILQHWDELEAPVQPKPFVVDISFSVPFSGTYE